MDKTICHLQEWIRKPNHLILILVFLLITQCGIAQDSKIRVSFVGDILLSRNVRTEFQTRNSSPFEAIKPFFKSADLVIGNLEGAVGNKNDQYSSKSDSPVFDIDSTHIRLLKDAGFNVITCENNHSFDLGEAGKINTVEALRKSDITPVYLGN